MFLRTLQVKNYLSLHDATLDHLGQLNVLVGRNNSGKSAVFGALAFLTLATHGKDLGRQSGDELAVVTARSSERSLEIRLVFEPRPKDREDFIHLIFEHVGTGDRMDRLLNSGFFRKVEYLFRAPPASPSLLHLRQTRLTSTDGCMVTVQQMKHHANERTDNPTSQFVSFSETLRRDPDIALDRATLEMIDLERRGFQMGRNNVFKEELPINSRNLMETIQRDFVSLSWLRQRVSRYLLGSFFFNPFRHCSRSLPAEEANQLARDGSNLAQVLDTIQSSDRSLLERIESVVHAAVPELGRLHTPARARNREIGFRSSKDEYFVHLHDMGGGVEQLLMVATVLNTTDDTHSLFLEEPESHLHPATQRFLIERLQVGQRQVFVTTHSPVLVNAPRPNKIYRVTYDQARTQVSLLRDADSLSRALADIGARNSDVLLSDAVLFVEGNAERVALDAWSVTLGTPLAEHNVTVLRMNGGEYAGREAPIRTEVLEGISQKAPIPHLFLLDRDERGQTEMARLRDALGERCHVLRAREMENYMLFPRALRAAVKSKCRDSSSIVEKVNQATDAEVEDVLRATADDLYGTVLLKRVRAEVAGLQGGLFSRDLIPGLLTQVKDQELARLLKDCLANRVTEHINRLDLEGIVEMTRQSLDSEWADLEQRLKLAPGDELVSAVFRHFGTEYVKPADTGRIAREMTKDEIPGEIQEIIRKAVTLAAHASLS